MSCDCNNEPSPTRGSGPCPPPTPAVLDCQNNEPIQSMVSNFITMILGYVTKTRVGNSCVWQLPCDLSGYFPGIPRNPNEGALCYMWRVIGLIVPLVGAAASPVLIPEGQDYVDIDLSAQGLTVNPLPIGGIITKPLSGDPDIFYTGASNISNIGYRMHLSAVTPKAGYIGTYLWRKP